MHKETMLGFLRIFARFAKELRRNGPKTGVESFYYVPAEGMELRISEAVFDAVFTRFRVEKEYGAPRKVYYLDGLKVSAPWPEGDVDE